MPKKSSQSKENLVSEFKELMKEAENKREKRRRTKIIRKKIAWGITLAVIFAATAGYVIIREYLAEPLPAESDREIISGFGPLMGKEMADGGYYFKYNGYIYYVGPAPRRNIIKLEEADVETFRIIDARYQTDKNLVYSGGQIIEGADPETFEPLEWPYAKDKSKVYYLEIKKLEGADPETFEVLEGGYQKDKDNVYYRNAPIEGADPETFEVMGSGYGKDKNHLYHFDRVIEK